MTDYSFLSRKTFVDCDKIQHDIQQNAALRTEQGVYEHFDFSRLTAESIHVIRDKKKFIREILQALNFSWSVNINAFKISSRLPALLAFFEKGLKKNIFKLLGFYTYRLFSQQREFNRLISLALHSEKQLSDEKITNLSKRLDALE